MRVLREGKVVGSVIDIQSEDTVSALKRAVGSAFATKNLLDYEPTVDTTLARMIQMIRRGPRHHQQPHSSSSPVTGNEKQTTPPATVIPTFEIMQQFQVDFLMKVAFSKDTDYLESRRSTLPVSGYTRFLHWARWQSLPDVERWLYKSPLRSAWWTRPGSSQKQQETPQRKETSTATGDEPVKLQAWADMASEEFQTRKRGIVATNSFLSSKPTKDDEEKLLKMYSQAGQDMPDLMAKYMTGRAQHSDIVSEAMVLRMVSSTISAGFDTTAYTMTTILYHLLTTPHAMKKLRAEIDVAMNSGRLSNPPRYVETDKLEYLAAVIKEAMRISTFFTFLLEREVPAGGADINGTFLPGGTVAAVSAIVVHRDADVFGARPDEFRPERWLEADQRQKVVMERSMLGFGAGKRICLGRHIAELEMKKVIPTLLLEFDVSEKCKRICQHKT